jgi:hypothetical protein
MRQTQGPSHSFRYTVSSSSVRVSIHEKRGETETIVRWVQVVRRSLYGVDSESRTFIFLARARGQHSATRITLANIRPYSKKPSRDQNNVYEVPLIPLTSFGILGSGLSRWDGGGVVA